MVTSEKRALFEWAVSKLYLNSLELRDRRKYYRACEILGKPVERLRCDRDNLTT